MIKGEIMRGAIEELYYKYSCRGDFGNSPQYQASLKRLVEACNELEAGFSDAQKKEFGELLDMQAKTDEILLMSFFKEGFRLGAKIMLDVLDGSKT